LTDEPVDIAARRRALTDLDSTLLVEAGAGTGKTAIMAGRVVALLAEGVEPHSIAAVTFTELAASELSQRIAAFIDNLLAGQPDPALRPAFSHGLAHHQRQNLEDAHARLDEIVCTTIHGFCQAMIRPYPVETDIDPGAAVVDPTEAAIVYAELFDTWLRERFDSEGRHDDVLVEMLDRWGDAAVKHIRETADFLRRHRDATSCDITLEPDAAGKLRTAVRDFRQWYDNLDFGEKDTATFLVEFESEIDRIDHILSNYTEAAALVELAIPTHLTAMRKNDFVFRAYQKRSKWRESAKLNGASQAHGGRIYDTAREHYDRCCQEFSDFFGHVSAALNVRYVREFSALQDSYAVHKRSAALLDFDDLIHTARNLIASDPRVRDALASRFRHILVDEFQDTDPLQCEIFWRLAGDPITDEVDPPWYRRRLRSGQLFLVGDPKQAIYRFRGADVHAYLQARGAIEAETPENVLAITHNFRSLTPILEWVNERFEKPLNDQHLEVQPLTGRPDPDSDATRVGVLKVAVEDDNPKAPDLRAAEADAVAELCRNLIGSMQVRDGNGGERPCEAGDIALLAPSGTGLYIYERALEQQDIPIATQAGKGFFRRQEIQDLIAIARVLADSRDTLALGALLRGPLVGLTEEELLDIVATLPRAEGREDRLPELRLWTPPNSVNHRVCREVLETLQSLACRARHTTPYVVLSDAVEELRVRPVLEHRHPRNAERALANVDLFFELAHPYAVRGLRSFARDMRQRWENNTRQPEGRPDAEAEAVQIITVHAAKGLEWPVVIPVNMMTALTNPSGELLRPNDKTVHLSFGGIDSPARAEVKETEHEKEKQQRIRFWYVACTRARDFLVLPELSYLPNNCWMKCLNFGLDALPLVNPAAWDDSLPARPAEPSNAQDRDTFVEQARVVHEARRSLTRHVPSRHEAVMTTDRGPIDEDWVEAAPEDAGMPGSVRGGAERGLVLHKLLEEVLTGETMETMDALGQRADTLLRQLGAIPGVDAANDFSPSEIAESVARALRTPAIASIRARLVPEMHVNTLTNDGSSEQLVSGVADALAPDDAAGIDAVVDWKSDVHPATAPRQSYRNQMLDYVQAVRAERGIIVYTTTGEAEEIRP